MQEKHLLLKTRYEELRTDFTIVADKEFCSVIELEDSPMTATVDDVAFTIEGESGEFDKSVDDDETLTDFLDNLRPVVEFHVAMKQTE